MRSGTRLGPARSGGWRRATRSGPIRDVVQSLVRAGQEHLAALVRQAQALGHVNPDVDPDQLALELQGRLDWTNYQFVLLDDPGILERGRRATEAMLDRVRSRGRRRTR